MGANIAGIYGAQTFRQDDRPRYRRAFAVACAVLAAGLLVAISHYVDDKIFKCRKATQVDDISSMTMRLQHTCLEMPGVRFR